MKQMIFNLVAGNVCFPVLLLIRKTIGKETEIDKDCTYGMHIYAGYQWLKDDDLEDWEKVEE